MRGRRGPGHDKERVGITEPEGAAVVGAGTEGDCREMALSNSASEAAFICVDPLSKSTAGVDKGA